MSAFTTFPRIITPSQELNRVQTNVQNTFSEVSSNLSQLTIIGEVKFSSLTLSQFQQQAGKGWVSADGTTSVVGSSYAQITNALVTPNVTAPSGTSAYIRIN